MIEAPLQTPGSIAAVGTQPASVAGERQNTYSILLNCYFQELLGPRTAGKLLNVGAGDASTTYGQARMFAATTYHTLESGESGISATYNCSATAMQPIVDEFYDWVISTFVLEHVDDPWAAAREKARVCKPGGYIYVAIPFSQILHPHATFGDYWRFTPQGLRQLFPACVVREIEVWGESPTRPNAFAVLFQKPGPGVAPAGNERSYWIEFPNEQVFEMIVPPADLSIEWPIYQLRSEPMNLAMQLNAARDQYAISAQLVVDNDTIARRFKREYAIRYGTLGVRRNRTFFSRQEA